GPEARRRSQRCRVMGRLHRPDTTFQPFEERHIVSRTPEQRLTEMDMCLDESRQEVVAARVDDLRVPADVIAAHRHYAPIADDDVTRDDVETGVHRDDRRVANQDGGGLAGGKTGGIGPRPGHSALILTLFIDIADVSTPRLTAISSARILTAISAGVT